MMQMIREKVPFIIMTVAFVRNHFVKFAEFIRKFIVEEFLYSLITEEETKVNKSFEEKHSTNR